MKTFGFTGRRKGITEAQISRLEQILSEKQVEFGYAVDGMCKGADTLFNQMAFTIGYYTIGRPGHPTRDPEDLSNRGNGIYEEEHPSEAYFARNRKIVDQSDIMIAMPYSKDFSGPGGTNYTINYTIKKGKQVVIILPDGELIYKNIKTTK